MYLESVLFMKALAPELLVDSFTWVAGISKMMALTWNMLGSSFL